MELTPTQAIAMALAKHRKMRRAFRGIMPRRTAVALARQTARARGVGR